MPLAAADAAPLIGSALGAGGAIFGASMQSDAQAQAAAAQLQGIQQAVAEQRYQYQQTRSDLGPYRLTGSSALDALAKIYGLAYVTPAGVSHGATGRGNYNSFYQSPDYQFALTQGEKAVTANAAATGGLDSGAIRKSEMKYASGLASENFNNYASRLYNLAGLGESASAMTGQLGANSANQISQLYQNAGAVQGQQYINQGNIWGNAFGYGAGVLGNSIYNPYKSSYDQSGGSSYGGYGPGG